MIKKIIAILIPLAILITCLFLSLDFQAFNSNFYQKKYRELNTAQSIGMSQEALDETTKVLLDYIQDKREDVHVIQEIKGFQKEVFNEQEITHMIDVKELYINFKTICTIIFVIGLISFFYMLYQIKTKKITLISCLFDLKDGFRQVILSFILIISYLLMSALIDFDRFWLMFHVLLFDNELWLLDPKTSIMINMFPQEFFFGMVMNVVITFIISFIGISCLFTYFSNCEINKKMNLIEIENK